MVASPPTADVLPAPPGPPTGARPTRREAALVAVLGLLLGWPMLVLPLGLDQGIYAAVAARMLDGHALYAGAWDMKPPGIFFFYAVPVALFGCRVAPIFLAVLATHIATALALFRLGAWVADRRVAWSAAAMYLVMAAGWGDPITLGQPDDLMLAPFLWGLLLLCGAWLEDGPPGWRRPFAAGLLLGWVLLLRSTMLFGVVLLPLLVGFTCLDRAAARAAWGLAPDAVGPAERPTPARPSSFRRFVRLVAWYVAGGATVGAAALLYFVATGALGDLLYCQFVWVRRYAATVMTLDALNWEVLGKLLDKSWYVFFDRWLMFRWSVPAGAVGFAVWCRLRGRTPWWAAGLWAGAMLLAASSSLLQMKFFNYHWWPVIPFWLLAGAFAVAVVIEGVAAAWRRGSAAAARGATPWRWRAAAIGAGALALAAAYEPATLMPWRPRTGWLRTLHGTLGQMHTGVRTYKEHAGQAARAALGLTAREVFVARFAFEHIYLAQEEVVLADRIRAGTPPGQAPRVYIWGFRPALYFLLGSGGPSRFPYNLPLRADWSPPEWLVELEEEVMREPPDWIVVGKHDHFAWVVGNHSRSQTHQPTWLRTELARHFEAVMDFKWLRLYRRTSPTSWTPSGGAAAPIVAVSEAEAEAAYLAAGGANAVVAR